MRETSLFIEGPLGPLEALYLPHEQPTGVALICHPNPVQGGTMLNKVVSTVQRTARDAGLTTLRFNYRGVGQSAGSHDMGAGEVADAEAVAAWLAQQHPELPQVILGFSFGGFVAASVAGRRERAGAAVQQLFMVAPAVMRLSEEFPLPQHCPITVIQPDADEVVPPAQVYAWSDALDRPHELLKVAECGHFFHGKLTDLKDLLLPRLSNIAKPE